MCRWYYLDVLKHQKLMKVIGQFQGDVTPGKKAPVVTLENQHYKSQLMTWGYEMSDKLIYNARSETILEKAFFQSVYTHRCLVPVSGFYEWNRQEEKYRYELDQPFYLAGIYQNHCFCIITTKANDSVKKIHHRMPLVLQGEDVKKWLSSDFQSVLNIKDYQFYTQKEI